LIKTPFFAEIDKTFVRDRIFIASKKIRYLRSTVEITNPRM